MGCFFVNSQGDLRNRSGEQVALGSTAEHAMIRTIQMAVVFRPERSTSIDENPLRKRVARPSIRPMRRRSLTFEKLRFHLAIVRELFDETPVFAFHSVFRCFCF